jgi:LacI family transcriptional regulator
MKAARPPGFAAGLQKNHFLQGCARTMDKLPQVVLLLESSRGAGRALLRGFANYARHHGPWTFNWEPGGLNEIWPRLNRLNAQGVFLRDGKHIRKVLALGIPTVVVGHRNEDFPDVAHVVTDSESAGRLAAEHLLGCGFKNFAFCGPSHIRWSAARRKSFLKRLKQSGRKAQFFKAPAEGRKTSWRSEHVVMGRWLKSLPKPVGASSG